MLSDNIMLTERKRQNSEVRKCSARTADGMHRTKNMRWLSEILLEPSGIKPRAWKHSGFSNS